MVEYQWQDVEFCKEKSVSHAERTDRMALCYGYVEKHE